MLRECPGYRLLFLARVIGLLGDWLSSEGRSTDVAAIDRETLPLFLVSPAALTRPDGGMGGTGLEGVGGTGPGGDDDGIGGTGMSGGQDGIGGTGIFGTITAFGSSAKNCPDVTEISSIGKNAATVVATVAITGHITCRVPSMIARSSSAPSSTCL